MKYNNIEEIPKIKNINKPEELSVLSNNDRFNLQFRIEPNNKKSKITTISFSRRIGATKEEIECISYWINDWLYYKRENQKIPENTFTAINMIKNRYFAQYKTLDKLISFSSSSGNTLENLLNSYIDYYTKTHISNRDPEKRKGNRDPVANIKDRAKWVLNYFGSNIDPQDITDEYLTKKFQKLLTEPKFGRINRFTKKRSITTECYSEKTLETYWMFLLLVFKECSCVRNKVLLYNPLRDLKKNDMPKRKGIIRKNRKDDFLTDQNRADLIDACSNNISLKTLVVYYLHKPTRLCEPKDMIINDLQKNDLNSDYIVHAKIDKKSKEVEYIDVELPKEVTPFFDEYLRYLKSSGKTGSDRLWGLFSDNSYNWSRSIRDRINLRVIKWNKKYPDRHIPLGSAINNRIRANAMLWMLEQKIDSETVAYMAGSSVKMIDRFYLKDSKVKNKTHNSVMNERNRKIG